MSTSDTSIPELAASLISQSPPGQVQDVVNDLRIIVGAASAQGAVDSEAEAQLLPHIRRQLAIYHRDNFQPVQVDKELVLLSDASHLKADDAEEPRYVDPTSRRSFALDHVRLTPTDFQPHEIPEELESYRAALDKSLKLYLSNHYTTSKSAGSVFCSSKPKPIKAEATEETQDVDTAPGAAGGEIEAEAIAEPKADPSDKEGDEPEGAMESQTESEAKTAAEKDVEKVVSAGAAAKEGEIESEEAQADSKEEAAADVAVEEASQEANTATDDAAPPRAEPVKAENAETEAEPDVPAPEGPPETPVYTVQIVGDKVNTTNFWSGRWRSSYVVDPTAAEIKASIRVDVHYFEAGNVQLAAKHSGTLPLPPAGDDQPSKIITAISKFESEYQLQLNETYSALGDKAFKALRRALPVYRTKIDWEKIGSYKAGWDWIAEGKKAHGVA